MRMMLIMIVSLFTSRIVLQQLGVTDFGINNVVGGLVTTLSFLTGAVGAGTSRYFSYYLGREDYKNLNQYFQLSIIIFITISILALCLAETVGLWFLNTQMVIDHERQYAANFVYQCAVFSFIFSMFQIPYQSLIIAEEKMSFYAYIGIVEVILKLLIVYTLMIGRFDKLIIYSILNMLVLIGMAAFYILYCMRKYKKICSFHFYFDKNKYKEFSSYSGWILFGALSGICRDQGVNIILNLFFGPVVNAARGIAYQVNRAVVQFINNFFMAVRPQIIKRYSLGNNSGMCTLVFSSSRLCYYLIILLSCPILIQTPIVLDFWLKDVPDYTILFTRLVIIIAIIESLANALDTAIAAHGEMKYFQIFTGGLLILNLPISYLLLKLGYGPESTMIVGIFIAISAHTLRIYFAKKYGGVPINKYCKSVLIVISYTTAAIMLPLILLYTSTNIFTSILGFIFFSTICLVWTSLIILIIGLNKGERATILVFVKNKLQHA